MQDDINAIKKGEYITSIYADVYFNNDYKAAKIDTVNIKTPQPKEYDSPISDKWVSPSDLLIDIVDLRAPFTSKITRGIAHKGILDKGEDILNKEHVRFLEHMRKVLSGNDAAWNTVLAHEKIAVAQKVKAFYQDILSTKCKTLLKEINIFYEKSLQELEDHLRSEVQTVLISAHTKIISDLNVEIRDNLKKEKRNLEKVLNKKYENEVSKVTHYYKLLLDNEIYKNTKLINKAIDERNDILKAFYKQIEAQNITGTMYVMCTERKKCRIRQFIIDNIRNTEISEMHKKLRQQQDIIDFSKEREKQISASNKAWEEKIKNVLQLFLKFISFSLKLLPEQATFLLNLEKMVVLQLNEIQKAPSKITAILIDTEDCNFFKFEERIKNETECDQEPFVIEGDLLGQTEPKYGSRETLPSDVDLPFMRFQRKFFYAKCGKMEEVRAFLDSERCKCRDPPPMSQSPPISPESSIVTDTKSLNEVKSQSSLELLPMDDIHILQDCPSKRCQDWAKKYSFPFLDSYLDYTEENYKNLKAVFGTPPERFSVHDLIDPKFMITQELPFSPTKEPYRNVETQCESQQDVLSDFECLCMQKGIKESTSTENKSESQLMNEITMKRNASIQKLLSENPKLLKLFTDEGFDYIYTIK